MTASLKSKAVHGLFWSSLDRFSQQGLLLLITIVLARLLLPKDFGLIGMLVIFMAIAQAFLNSGFGQALIQKKDATHVDSCSIFYFSIVVGFIASGLLCWVAPWIADFYHQPLLTPLTQVMSLNILISSFGIVHATLLAKKIDFKTQTKVGLAATSLSGAIGVAMAFLGFGVWSLAVQRVCSNLFRTILLWLLSQWHPSLIFSLTALRRMFTFGSRLLFSGLLDTIFQHIYLVVIGRIFTPADLGFYATGNTIQQLPTANVSTVVNRVTFPVFSAVQGDLIRLKRNMRKGLRLLAFLNLPIMMGLIVIAKPLVHVLLTEKWAPCVRYLQLLCVVGMLYPLHVLNLNLLLAKGHSDIFLRLEILKRILVVISIAITYRWGIQAMIYGQIVTSFLGYYMNSYYSGRLADYPLRKQVADMVPYFSIAGLMGIGAYSIQWLPFSNNWSLLICQILVGLLVYAALSWAFRVTALEEILTVCGEELERRKAKSVGCYEVRG